MVSSVSSGSMLERSSPKEFWRGVRAVNVLQCLKDNARGKCEERGVEPTIHLCLGIKGSTVQSPLIGYTDCLSGADGFPGCDTGGNRFCAIEDTRQRFEVAIQALLEMAHVAKDGWAVAVRA